MAILLFLERTLLLGFYGLPILWAMLDCFWEILLQHYRQVHSSHPAISAIIRIYRVELVSADASFTSSKPFTLKRRSIESFPNDGNDVNLGQSQIFSSTILVKAGSPIHGGNTVRTYDVTECFSRLRWGRNESRTYSSSLSFHESSKWDLKHYATLQQVASLGDVRVPSILLFQVHCFLSLSLHPGINVFLLFSLSSFIMFSTRKLALNSQ